METKILKVNPKSLKLLKVNARYMKQDEFNKLVANIKRDGCLTQLPFCCKDADENKWLVLSGNHRVKAAIEAGLEEIEKSPTISMRYKDYEEFMNTCNDVGKGVLVKNTALAFMCMLKLAQHNIDQLQETWIVEAKPKDMVPISSIFGRSDIKASDGLEVNKALSSLVDKGIIKKTNKSDGLVKLAQYYLENEKRNK